MDIGSFVDLGLDEIIQLKKKCKQGDVARAEPIVKKRGIPVRKSAGLSRPTKFGRVAVTQAILRRARQTIWRAGKITAGTEAATAPFDALGNYGRGVGGRDVRRNSRAINGSSVAQRRNVRRNGVLLRQQQQRRRQRTRCMQDLRNGLSVRRQQQQQIPVQQAEPIIGRRYVNLRAGYMKSMKNSDIAPRRGLSRASRYRQYMQEARVLIGAQRKFRNFSVTTANSNRSRNIYMDVPPRMVSYGGAGGDGFNGNRGRGRGRGRGGRFTR